MKHAADLPFQQLQNNRKKTKKAILWGGTDLLVSGFEVYLNTHLDWEVIRIAEEGGITGLLQIMKMVHPDVVLLDRGYCADNDQLATLLFQAQPGVCVVVTFSLENNLAEVYTKQVVEITQVSDLLQIINRHTS